MASSTQGFMNARPAVSPSHKMSSLVGIWIFYFRSTIPFTSQGVPATCLIEESHLSPSTVSQVLSISVEDIGLGLISTKNVSFQVPTHLSLSIKCPLEAPSHKSPWLTHGPIGGQSSMVHSTSPVSLTLSSLDSTFCSVGVDRLFSIIVTPKGNR